MKLGTFLWRCTRLLDQIWEPVRCLHYSFITVKTYLCAKGSCKRSDHPAGQQGGGGTSQTALRWADECLLRVGCRRCSSQFWSSAPSLNQTFHPHDSLRTWPPPAQGQPH